MSAGWWWRQGAERIGENVALLARVIASRIDAGRPFSALSLLWLSLMAAVRLLFATRQDVHDPLIAWRRLTVAFVVGFRRRHQRPIRRQSFG
jgi:hypothetical protein